MRMNAIHKGIFKNILSCCVCVKCLLGRESQISTWLKKQSTPDCNVAVVVKAVTMGLKVHLLNTNGPMDKACY